MINLFDFKVHLSLQIMTSSSFDGDKKRFTTMELALPLRDEVVENNCRLTEIIPL